MLERTLVLVKPDGIQRALVGEIIGRFENKGLKLVGLKLMQMDQTMAAAHYEAHKGRDFYDSLINFVTSGPVVAMVLESVNAIFIVRKLVGSTRPNEADPGTIRGDYCVNTQFNVIHASDSLENAKREIDIFFRPEELVRYERSIMHWLGLSV